ncbi:hypothetical protein ACE1OA_11210 [Streptomyces sp. JL2001]|uniref:hypothetical protein n=1 Tax=Streptomyces sp. JL2001 TaxID=3342488 RepID=UPI003D8086F7
MAESKKDEAATGLSSAADRIRESAKWLLVSFAAVGVTLFGGLQLANIGRLQLDDPIRWVPAVGGVALGLAGLAIAIYAASSVVTESYASLAWLSQAEGQDIRGEVEQDSLLLGGYENVQALASEIKKAQLRKNKAYTARYAEAPVGEVESYRKARLERLDAEFYSASYALQSLSQVEQRILHVASLRRVAKAYEDSRKTMFLGAGMTALGIALFAWGANPPDPAESVEAEQVLPPSPSDVIAMIENDDVRAERPLGVTLREALGADCDLSKVAAIALSAAGDTYDLVSIKTNRCNVAYFKLNPSQGKVLPRVAPEEGAKAVG